MKKPLEDWPLRCASIMVCSSYAFLPAVRVTLGLPLGSKIQKQQKFFGFPASLPNL